MEEVDRLDAFVNERRVVALPEAATHLQTTEEALARLAGQAQRAVGREGEVGGVAELVALVEEAVAADVHAEARPVSGRWWNVFGDGGSGHVRMSYARSMPELREAMDRMAAYVDSL